MTRQPRFSAVATVLAVVAISSIAMAGKPERDKAKELESKVSALKEDMKTRCGCDVNVTVDWASYKAVRDMGRIEVGLKSLTEATKNTCTSPEEKKILCAHLKSYAVRYKTNLERPKLEGSTIICETDDTHYCGESLVKEIVDTF